MSEAEPPAKKNSLVRSALSLGLLVLVLTSARSTLGDHYTVPSGSMEPTIQIGDRILVNKLAFGIRVPFSGTYLLRFEGPHRGDVVILRSPADGRTLVKRVMGLPGERVEVRDGFVFVDGTRVEEPDTVVRGGRDWGPKTIPDGFYLVLGDNRPHSFDGRSFGLVPRGEIWGRALRIYMRDSSFTWRDL